MYPYHAQQRLREMSYPTGNIYDGIIPTVDAQIAGEFGRIMAWADKYRTLKVRSSCLHLCNLRISNCKTASSVTHHRVELVEAVNESLT